MGTHLEFRSGALCDPPGTGPRGALLARQLLIGLPVLGFCVARAVPQDWGQGRQGWCVPVENRRFPLWIGCGPLANDEDRHLCFITPSKPRVWSWYGRVDTVPTVERLANALEACIRRSGVAHHLRWWSEDEVQARR